MIPLIGQFQRLNGGDRFRFFASLFYVLFGGILLVRGLVLGVWPAVLGTVLLAFGTYRLYYFYRFFRKGGSA